MGGSSILQHFQKGAGSGENIGTIGVNSVFLHIVQCFLIIDFIVAGAEASPVPELVGRKLEHGGAGIGFS